VSVPKSKTDLPENHRIYDKLATQALIAAWHTNHRVTSYLIENLPAELWPMKVPGYRQRTIRRMAAHIHNSRCGWVKSIGGKHGVTVPKPVDINKVRQTELIKALERSSRGIVDLIRLGAARGGAVPPADWQNFPTDLAHFLSYFVAHEAHHRGQLILLAQQLGHPLPKKIIDGMWQWKTRSREFNLT
jgi:uncharacterized damage-inducible protein DinB